MMLIFSSNTENCRITDIPWDVNIISGHSQYSQVRKGQIVTFRCKNPATFIHGTSEVECLENGQWSHSFPTCRGNSILLLWGGILWFKMLILCSLVKSCKYSKGSWHFPHFPAPLNCNKPPGLENGDLRDVLQSEYQHGDRVVYVCQHLYVLEGTSYRTCHNGIWIGSMTCRSKWQ